MAPGEQQAWSGGANAQNATEVPPSHPWTTNAWGATEVPPSPQCASDGGQRLCGTAWLRFLFLLSLSSPT